MVTWRLKSINLFKMGFLLYIYFYLVKSSMQKISIFSKLKEEEEKKNLKIVTYQPLKVFRPFCSPKF